MAFLLWLQQFRNTPLDIFFSFWTLAGTEEFYLVAIPLIYWLWDRRLGLRLAVFFSCSMFLNAWLKDIFALPRPHGGGLKVLFAGSAGGYGFPSGHAQGSVGFWGYLAAKSRNSKFTLAALSAILLISFSRLYLGVHYPADILGGLLIGAAWVVLALYLERLDWETAAFFKRILALVLPLILLAFYQGETAYKLAGSVSGSLWGYWWAGSSCKIPRGVKKNIWKAAAALGVLQLVRYGLKPLFPWQGWGDYLRYAVIGFSAYGPLTRIFDK